MNANYYTRCDKVRYSPCAAVCFASSDQAAREKAIIAMHEHDMRHHARHAQAAHDRRINDGAP